MWQYVLMLGLNVLCTLYSVGGWFVRFVFLILDSRIDIKIGLVIWEKEKNSFFKSYLLLFFGRDLKLFFLRFRVIYLFNFLKLYFPFLSCRLYDHNNFSLSVKKKKKLSVFSRLLNPYVHMFTHVNCVHSLESIRYCAR